MELGANDLPYRLPIHPNLVHLTIGLFVIAIAFDIAGALFPFERRLFRFLALPVTRSGLHDVGWYNLLACCLISFFTVAAGFVEMQLADPLPGVTSSFAMGSTATMLWHGAVGVGLLFAIVLMTLWRGLQRFRWRREMGRQVQWGYLLVGLIVFALMAWHGTLGAQLGVEFGVHVTASQLLGEGASLQEALP